MTLSRQLSLALSYTRCQELRHGRRKQARRKAVFIRARMLIRDVRLKGGHISKRVEQIIVRAI
jgi:hypothetical protein